MPPASRVPRISTGARARRRPVPAGHRPNARIRPKLTLRVQGFIAIWQGWRVYKPQDEFAAGASPAAALPVSAGNALDLSLADILAAAPTAPGIFTCRRARLAAMQWVPDLAEEIGSRQWYRGLATLVLLACAALAFWPDLSRLDAAVMMRLDLAAQDEFRSQAIMPLGYGADSGRRTGPTMALREVGFVPERPRIDLAAVLTEDDTLGQLLQRAGVSAADAAGASQLVGGALPLDQISPSTRVSLVLGPRSAPDRPRPLERLDFRARFDLALAVVRAGPGLALQSRPIPVDTTPLRIRGVVGDSLYRSARAAGAPPQAIQEYLQALDSHLSLEGDVRAGDSFDLVFAYKRAATGETEPGDLIYAGLERGAQPVTELLRWGRDGAFYSAEAIARPSLVQSGPGLLTPVNGRITSLYGQRVHPLLGYTRMHAGVDFGASWGSPIVAAAEGIVSYAGYHGGHGNYVRLEHGGGLGTGYGHMSRIAVGPGERVGAGEVIGFVGSTGLSTGPHLHYEMYQDGRTVNPLGMRMETVTRQVDPKELGAFRARLAQMKALRPGVLMASARKAAPQIAMR